MTPEEEKQNNAALVADHHEVFMTLMRWDAEAFKRGELYETAYTGRDVPDRLAEFLTVDRATGTVIVKKLVDLPNPADKTKPLNFIPGTDGKLFYDAFVKSRAGYLNPKFAEPVRDLVEEAFGEKATLEAQGRLVKTMGKVAANAVAERWGTALGSLKPGKRPPEVVEKKEPPLMDLSNPWSVDGRDNDPRVKEARMKIIKTNTQMASKMAAKFGKRVDGRPLVPRLYNF